MKWAYGLAADEEPIIKDEIVYDGTVIAQGEGLQLGVSAFTAGADAGYALVNCSSTTVASATGLNFVGMSTQTISTAGNGLFYSLGAPASVATAANSTAGNQSGLRSSTAFAYSKTIINPLAVYRTLVGTAGALAVASAASAGTSGQFAVTGVPASAMNGSWVYFCGTGGPNFGQIRKVVTSATAGTQVLDAVTTNAITTADKVLFISERNTCPHLISSAQASTANTNVGTTIGQTTVAGNGFTNFRVIENYIEGGTYTGGITELRYEVTGQYSPAYNGTTALVNKLSTVNFYQDIISLSHAFKG